MVGIKVALDNKEGWQGGDSGTQAKDEWGHVPYICSRDTVGLLPCPRPGQSQVSKDFFYSGWTLHLIP